MTPAPAILYCVQSDLEDFISVDGVVARVDDDQSGTVSAVSQRQINGAIASGTDRVNLYLLARYPANDLATSTLVKDWTVLCALKWLSMRRGNPPPTCIDKAYEDAIKDLERARKGEFQIPGLGARDCDFPAWANVRVDHSHPLRKVRVERPISDRSPSKGYSQNYDWFAEYVPYPG